MQNHQGSIFLKRNQVKLSIKLELSTLSLETVIQSLIECVVQRFTI